MQFTLGGAARQCGVAKGTISKAIKTGKLSATVREDGSYAIDGSELARYLEAHGHRFRSDTGPETHSTDRLETNPATDLIVASLQATIAILQDVNASLETKYASLERDRDIWREHFERLQLPAPKREEIPLQGVPEPEAVQPKPPSQTALHALVVRPPSVRRPWWRRLAG